MDHIIKHPKLSALRHAWEFSADALTLVIGDTLLSISESPGGHWLGMRYFVIGDGLAASADYDSRLSSKSGDAARSEAVEWLVKTAQEKINERIR